MTPWPILIIFGMQHHEETDYSFAHLTLILLLHYLVKCRSHILAVYKCEFILGSTSVGSAGSRDAIFYPTGSQAA